MALLWDLSVLTALSAALGTISLVARPNVRWLAEAPAPATCTVEGEPMWAEEQLQRQNLPAVSPEAIQTEVIEGTFIVVDARPSHSYRSGHIPGAISLPADTAEIQLAWGEVKIDSSRPILTYCDNKDAASTVVGNLLNEKLGCDVRILEGGFEAWLKANGPVEQASKEGIHG